MKKLIFARVSLKSWHLNEREFLLTGTSSTRVSNPRRLVYRIPMISSRVIKCLPVRTHTDRGLGSRSVGKPVRAVATPIKLGIFRWGAHAQMKTSSVVLGAGLRWRLLDVRKPLTGRLAGTWLRTLRRQSTMADNETSRFSNDIPEPHPSLFLSMVRSTSHDLFDEVRQRPTFRCLSRLQWRS